MREGATASAWRKVAVALVVIGALWIIGRRAGQYVPQFAQWVDASGGWGPIVFIVGYIAATVAFVPGVLLTLAAGAIFGIVEGTVYVFVAATLGACAAFLVARYLARGLVVQRLGRYPRFTAVDRAIGREGRKIVLLLRLSPVFPFNVLNYALGVTDVRFLDYALGCIGMLPATLLYVYYGKVAGDVAAAAAGAAPERSSAGYALVVVGLIATVAVTTVVTRVATKALREQVQENELGTT